MYLCTELQNGDRNVINMDSWQREQEISKSTLSISRKSPIIFIIKNRTIMFDFLARKNINNNIVYLNVIGNTSDLEGFCSNTN
jgi:hypothetical protein